MIDFINVWSSLYAKGVIGINERNSCYILRYNDRKYYPLVDDKIITKQLSSNCGIRVPKLYAVIETEHDITKFKHLVGKQKDFVIKPASGSGGDGIIVINEHVNNIFQTTSGSLLTIEHIENHLSNIVAGLYSLSYMCDRAIIEYRVIPDDMFNNISFKGVADVRIIVFLGFPVMAMLRLPTKISDGKANLHQGAVGVGVDLHSGCTTYGVLGNKIISTHPDTGGILANVTIPMWQDFLEIASACYEVTNLGFIGVDLVLDKKHGPLLLEINARPGLNIQIANQCGLRTRLSLVESYLQKFRYCDVKKRVALSKIFFK